MEYLHAPEMTRSSPAPACVAPRARRASFSARATGAPSARVAPLNLEGREVLPGVDLKPLPIIPHIGRTETTMELGNLVLRELEPGVHD